MWRAAGAGYVDTAVNRVDPGRAGIGTTIPVVPRIESPPTMPRRALSVLAASASPPGIEIDDDVAGASKRSVTANGRSHHLARHRIDRGLPGGSGGLGHCSHAFARNKATPDPGVPALTVVPRRHA